jgi:hypothetical protein
VTARTAHRELRDFVASHQGVEALVQRVGRDTFDLIVVDADGNWTRVVFDARDDAAAAATDLGLELHDGWTADLAKRMNRRDHWNRPGGHRRAL